MNRSILLRGVCAALLVATGLAGCANYGGAAGQQLFDATLSGSQEVPAATTAGSGKANVRYNPSTTMLSWSVTHSGLSGPVTAAHIHGPAAVGANAVPIVPFDVTGAGASGTLTGTFTQTSFVTIPPDSLDKLMTSGNAYVNLHTAANAAGEIRGQLSRQP